VVDLVDRPAVRRVLIAVVALQLLVGVVAAVDRRDSGLSGDARLRTDGIAMVTRGGASPRSVNGTFALLAGDVVEAAKGTITIDVPGGAQLEGRAGAGQTAATKVLIAAPGQPSELMTGELLVSASRGADIDAGGNRVHLDAGTDGPSAMRVARSLAVGAGVYHGSATVDSAGQRRDVQALRQIEVAVLGRPPTNAKPLKLNSDDPWDRRYLGAAIDLGRRLDELSTGYTSTLRRTDTRTVAFYRTLLPALATETSFTQTLLMGEREQGELLVGGAIATLGRKTTFADRWDKVFGLRDDGAAWGLIALDQGVSQDPLLSELDKAVNSTGLEFAQPTRSVTTPTAPPVTTTTPSTNPTSPTGPSTTRPRSNPPPTTSPPPPTTQPLLPTTGVPPADDLINTVNDVVGGLLGSPAPP
jgi:hypothetical protein